MQRLATSLLLLMAATAAAGPARAEAPCHPAALGHLKKLAPAGYAVYAQIGSKKDFMQWVTCDDLVMGLTTAVHETVHMLSVEKSAYPLIGGGTVAHVPESDVFYPPRTLAGKFDKGSQFVETYLTPGHASSADLLKYLLDELNAYTHDLNSAVLLIPIKRRDRDVYHRDGLAALMAFTAAYMEEARLKHPETWAALKKPAVRKTIGTLWGQAERVMASSCRIPSLAYEAPSHLARICKATMQHGLGQVLGRPPLCSVSCVKVRPAQRASNSSGAPISSQ